MNALFTPPDVEPCFTLPAPERSPAPDVHRPRVWTVHRRFDQRWHHDLEPCTELSVRPPMPIREK